MFGRQKQKTNEQNTHPTLCVGSQVGDKDLGINHKCFLMVQMVIGMFTFGGIAIPFPYISRGITQVWSLGTVHKEP